MEKIDDKKRDLEFWRNYLNYNVHVCGGGCKRVRPGHTDIVICDQKLLLCLHLISRLLTGLERAALALIFNNNHNETCYSWKIPRGMEMTPEFYFIIFVPLFH